jgi:hypothetical protein
MIHSSPLLLVLVLGSILLARRVPKEIRYSQIFISIHECQLYQYE